MTGGRPGGGAEAAARGLACRAGGARLVLPAAALEAILPPAPLTRVPQAPAVLLGMANLRGAPVPVVSLARLLGREEPPPGRAARLLLLRASALLAPLALSVEAVLGLEADAAPLDLAALLARAFLRPSVADAPPQPEEAAPPAAAAPDDARLALLTVRLGEQELALPLEAVEAVLRLPPGFAPLPGLGEAALGLLPYRGQALPLLSLAALLGRPAEFLKRDSSGRDRLDRSASAWEASGRGVPGAAARVLVLRQAVAGGGMVRAGLLVDAVRATLSVPAAAVEPVPPILARGLAAGQGARQGTGRFAAIARLEEGRRLLPILAPAPLLEDAPSVAAEVAGGGIAGPAEAEPVLLLRVAQERYALPLAAVAEVARAPVSRTRLPGAPDSLCGVMTLRGEALPVLDLRHLLGLPAARAGEQPVRAGPVVVVRLGGLRAALAVDAVLGLRALPRAALAPPPIPGAASGAAPLVAGAARLPAPQESQQGTGEAAGITLLLAPGTLLGGAEAALRAALERTGAARAAGIAAGFAALGTEGAVAP